MKHISDSDPPKFIISWSFNTRKVTVLIQLIWETMCQLAQSRLVGQYSFKDSHQLQKNSGDGGGSQLKMRQHLQRQHLLVVPLQSVCE